MSGLRAFHILETLTQILNAFLQVPLYLTLKLGVLFLVMIMDVINFCEVRRTINV